MGTEPLERVVYVDDEQHIRMIAQMALSRVGGFQTLICASGRELIEQAASFSPQMILLDVMMPDLDGPGTLEEIRKIPGFSDTPVVFVTAKTRPSEVERFKRLGAIDVLPKPFKPLSISNEIKDIWSRNNVS